MITNMVVFFCKTIHYTLREKSQKIIFRAFRKTSVKTFTFESSIRMLYFWCAFELYQDVSLDHVQFSCKCLATKHISQCFSLYVADFERTEVVGLQLRDC